MNASEKDLGLIPLDDIDPETLKIGEVLYSDRGIYRCLYGYRPADMKADIFCYALCVGFRNVAEENRHRFIELRNGALTWSFKPESRFGAEYHASNLVVVLPSGSNNFFGIIHKDGSLHKEATAHTFGFDMDELEEIIKSYCKVVGIRDYRAGRVTFSKTRDNECDLTGTAIPREFPYVTLASSGYIWSHISLFGFYSHLALLLHSGEVGGFWQEMLSTGVRQEWLQRIQDMPTKVVGLQVPLERF